MAERVLCIDQSLATSFLLELFIQNRDLHAKKCHGTPVNMRRNAGKTLNGNNLWWLTTEMKRMAVNPQKQLSSLQECCSKNHTLTLLGTISPVLTEKSQRTIESAA